MLYDPRRDFKSANELKLPHWVRDALIEVLRMFEADEVREVHRDDAGFFPNRLHAKAVDCFFNMSVWKAEVDCGTVMCIGGWIEHIAQRRFAPILSDDDYPELFALCHPCWDEDGKLRCWNRFTIPQACLAIRYYLTTGDGKNAWGA